ncbi:MAG: hypothetical protein IJV60_00490 [Prevotella sp.]|nr:hypothetical protein [Prevotella sp.]MBQ8115278.1 hypothetical protein [Prevotella sp.]
MKKQLLHSRGIQKFSGGGGDSYTWITLNTLIASTNGRLIPIYALGHKANSSYNPRWAYDIGFASSIYTTTPSNIRDTARIHSNGGAIHQIRFSYHKDGISYVSNWVPLTSSETIVVNGSNVSSVYTYYNSDSTKCFAEDMYEAGGVVYFSGALSEAKTENWYVMIKTSDYGLL